MGLCKMAYYVILYTPDIFLYFKLQGLEISVYCKLQGSENEWQI